MISKWKEIGKLIRLQILGVSTPPVIGGLTVAGDTFTWSQFFPLFLLGLFAQIYGFVLNDLGDIELDKTSKDLSERPLVKGTVSKKTAVFIVLISLVLGFGIAYGFFRNLSALFVLLILTVMGSIYDLFGKKFVGSDLLVAGATGLLCLFGAMVVSESDFNFHEIDYLTWIVVTTAFIQMLYMNVVDGGIKDADHDYKAKIKTIAVELGIRANTTLTIPTGFKIFALCLRSCSILMIFTPFLIRDQRVSMNQIAILGLMVVVIYFYMFKMLNMTRFNRDRITDCIRIQEILRYSLVPVMLGNYIGWFWCILLILIPFIWFAVSTFLLFGKPLSRPTTL